MKNWKKMIVTAAAFGSLALFAGCTTASAVSLDEAKEIVQQTVGAPNAVVVELDTDRDDRVYELEVLVDGVSYEFEVDSRTGQVREAEQETARPAAETQPRESEPAAITLEEAKAIAYAHAGVNEADAWDKSYERDDGMYEIDFEYDGWDYEYDISYTGQILKSEKDPDDDRRTAAPAETTPTETKPAETTPAETKPQRITAEEAWTIALNHAGLTASDIRDRDCEWDDGRWELSFESGRTEYEYKISADGTILKAEKDTDD